MAFALLATVSAVPVDESVVGDVYGADASYNPQDPNAILLKLIKLKKLLFLG